jgi:hypothetical protein
MISELVLSVNLASSRGASEAVRVRQLREGVGLIKQALEVAMATTKERHMVHSDKDEENKPRDAPRTTPLDQPTQRKSP